MPKQAVDLEEQLRACFEKQYGLTAVTFEFLPLGLDYNAAVYRVVSEQGIAYLLKAKEGSLYQPGCLVPRYLNDQGITAVVAPIPTKGGALWTQLEGWAVIVYPFIEGDTSWIGMTDEQWREVGATFKRIHQATLPSCGFESLRREAFDTMGYAQSIRSIEDHHEHVREGASASERALCSSWAAHRSRIHRAITTLESLGDMLQKQDLPYVVCHADLHPANLLRDYMGHVFVIDWDEVMLAPKERDFLFIKVSSDDSEALPGTPAFFQGYGPAEIDWIALTYYRYERVIQDLIACAQQVLFRSDLEESVREEAVELFQAILAEGGGIDAATHASVHLPSDLTMRIGKD